jgi:SAM-dependent methyltransferase
MNPLSRAAPFAKRYLPKAVLRFLLLSLPGPRRLRAHIRRRPSRLFLENTILPWIAQRHARVLFVGTAPYAYQIARLFRRGGDHYTTIERERAGAMWGARTHIVAPIEEIGRHRPNGHFDCIVLNGLFGFGIDDIEAQRAAIKVLHNALAPGGLLLVGWNTNLVLDLSELGLYAPYFTAAEDLPWPNRIGFPLPETHVYDFFRSRLPGTEGKRKTC